MSVLVTCPSCGQPYRVAKDSAGRQARCKKCNRAFVVIAAAQETVSPRAHSATETAEDFPTNVQTGSPPGSELPRQIGRFEIRAGIAGGAFGIVYRAWDPVLKREVALKVPRATAYATPDARARLEREPAAAAQLRHPNIVPIFDAGRDGEQFYIASAFIEGQTLKEAIDAKRLNLSRGIEMVRKLADALGYAHEQKIVHRDVKPANVLLDKDGEPHLTDFGLARWDQIDQKLTQDGSMLGTPAYMSPEQAGAPYGDVDALSDQYNLGVILYELLCCRLPFDLDQHIGMLLHQIRESEPPKPREIISSIPKDLETICLKTLSKRPADRYASCRELAEDLRRWVAGEPIRARRLGPVERIVRWCRREPLLAGAVAIILVSLSAATLIALISSHYIAEARDDAVTSQHRAEQAQQRAEGALRAAETARQSEQAARRAEDVARRAEQLAHQGESDARQKEMEHSKSEATALAAADFALYANRIGSAQQALENGSLTNARQLLDACKPRSGQFDPRRWEWFYLDRLVQGGKSGLTLADTAGENMMFSPDGRLLAAQCRNHSDVGIWDAIKGTQSVTLKSLETIEQITWSSDGEYLIAVNQRKAGVGRKTGVWRTNGGALLATINGRFCGVASIPNGARVAAIDDEESHDAPTINVWDMATNRTRSIRTTPVVNPPGFISIGSAVNSAALNSDGTQIAVYREDRRGVTVYDALSGDEKWSSATVRKPIVFQPHGQLLVTGNYASIAGKNNLLNAGATNRPGSMPSVGARQEVESLTIWDARSGTDLLIIAGYDVGSPSQPITFSPSGKLLATQILHGHGPQMQGAKSIVVDLSTLKLVLTADTAMSERLADFDEGETVFCASDGKGMINLFNLKTGRLMSRLNSPPSVCVEFSSDGKRLFSDCKDSTIRVFSAAGFVELATLRVRADKDHFERAVYSRNRESIAVRGQNALTVWESSDNPNPMTVADSSGTIAVSSIALSPDSKGLFVGARDLPARLLDLRAGTGEPINLRGPISRSGTNGERISIGTDFVIAASFSADAESIVIACEHFTEDREKASGRINGSPSSEGNFVLRWDTTSRRVTRRTALAGLEKGGLLSVPLVLPGSVFFSREGSKLACLSKGRLRIWDTENGRIDVDREISDAPNRVEYTRFRADFSPNGKLFALADTKEKCVVWQVAGGKSAFELNNWNNISSVRFSDDGKYLAGCRVDSDKKTTVLVWDLSLQKTIADFPVRSIESGALAFSPDGDRLVTSSNDHTLKIWNVATGQEVMTLGAGFMGPAGLLSFSHDGRFLVSADVFATRVFDGGPQAEKLLKGSVSSDLDSSR